MSDDSKNRIGLRSATLKSEASSNTLGSSSKTLSGKNGPHISECEEPLRNTIIGGEFQRQMRKWAHHHRLPDWASQSLGKHIFSEVERRTQLERMQNMTLGAMIKPWKWVKMWHGRKMHKGDIAFPVPQAVINLPRATSVDDETTLMDTCEAVLTQDLVKEIMDDTDDYYTNFDAKEKAGPAPVNPWLPIDQLKKRNSLFNLDRIHYNTVRSIALVGHKPGDPTPGVTKFNTRNGVKFGSTLTATQYDPEIYIINEQTATHRGIITVSTDWLYDYAHTK